MYTNLFYSFFAISPYLPYWEHLLGVYGKPVLDVDLWLIARQEDSPPHFGNLYQRAVLTRLKQITEQKYGVEVDFYINAEDTHLLINGEAVTSIDEYYLACFQVSPNEEPTN